MTKGRLSLQKGFSSVEILLGVLVLVVIGGAGYTVMQKNLKTTESNSTSETPVVAAPKSKVDTTKVGTTAGLDQLTTLDQTAENSVDAKYEATEKTESTSANTAIKNVGGAVNESAL